MMVDSDPAISEEIFSMWNVPAASQPEQQFLLQQLQLLSSSGIAGQEAPQGNPPDVPRSTAEDHGERAVQKLQATLQKGKTSRK